MDQVVCIQSQIRNLRREGIVDVEADDFYVIAFTENWAASDVGSDSNHELGDDDSV